jgi:AcrR family transcriptional regulator
VERAIEELDWVLERWARVVLIRPAPVPGYRGSRSFGLEEFDPFWQKVVEDDVLVAVHSSDSGYERYANDWMGRDSFGCPSQWGEPGSSLRGQSVIIERTEGHHCVRSTVHCNGKLSHVAKQKLAANELEADSLSWREQAVARSLDSARLRAEGRVQRFLDAAIELFNSGSGRDFTVQEVVDRSGQSLRSFYQYFGGKHELLLALFEESVHTTTKYLRDKVSEEDDALERLHSFVVEYYRLCRPSPEGKSSIKGRAPFMAEFAQQLLTEHPKEAARVFSPLVSLFEEVLGEAEAAGDVRAELGRGPIVGVVLEAIMFNTFSSTIGGLSARPHTEGSAEDLWELIFHGIGTSSTSS